MDNSNLKIDTASALLAISANLLELRDALVTLSLGLKDLQFETDADLRKEAEDSVLQMIQEISTSRNPPP